MDSRSDTRQPPLIPHVRAVNHRLELLPEAMVGVRLTHAALCARLSHERVHFRGKPQVDGVFAPIPSGEPLEREADDRDHVRVVLAERRVAERRDNHARELEHGIGQRSRERPVGRDALRLVVDLESAARVVNLYDGVAPRETQGVEPGCNLRPHFAFESAALK